MFNRLSIRRTAAQNQPERRRGAALVEMAVCLPVFLTVMLGMIELGRAIMVGQLVTNAAREGARLAIIDGSTNTQVTDAVKSFLTGAAGVPAGDITVTITVSGSSSGNQLSNAKPRDLVTVNVSVPFSKVSYLPAKYMAGKKLTGVSAMRHE
jgi:Flp pilus assembly protein TadG